MRRRPPSPDPFCRRDGVGVLRAAAARRAGWNRARSDRDARAPAPILVILGGKDGLVGSATATAKRAGSMSVHEPEFVGKRIADFLQTKSKPAGPVTGLAVQHGGTSLARSAGAIPHTCCTGSSRRKSPLNPRSAGKRQDRRVTPEVAGSSPVAPVKLPANRHIALSVQTRESDRLHKRAFEAGRNGQQKGAKLRSRVTF